MPQNANAANAKCYPEWKGLLEVEVFLSGLPHLALAARTLQGSGNIQHNAEGTRSNKSQNSNGGWHNLTTLRFI
jgi:hypothetical protein